MRGRAGRFRQDGPGRLKLQQAHGENERVCLTGREGTAPEVSETGESGS